MALANFSAPGSQVTESTIRSHAHKLVQFDLDGSYTTGGYTTFSTSVATILGSKITMVGARQTSPAGGYRLFWDRANDKLMVYEYPTTKGVSTEVANGTNLAAITDVEMEITYV